MAAKTEIILRNGRVYKRQVEESHLGWINELLDRYYDGAGNDTFYQVHLSEEMVLGLSATKVVLAGYIPGFDFSCQFRAVSLDEDEVFFVPVKSNGVEMTVAWRPPSDARCVAGYIFDRLKKYLDTAFVYMVPKELPKGEDLSENLYVPELTNIYASGNICLGDQNRPKLGSFKLWEFREDFIHRMSTIPWNTDLFPDSIYSMAVNRWDAYGNKVDYELSDCRLASEPEELGVIATEFLYNGG